MMPVFLQQFLQGNQTFLQYNRSLEWMTTMPQMERSSFPIYSFWEGYLERSIERETSTTLSSGDMIPERSIIFVIFPSSATFVNFGEGVIAIVDIPDSTGRLN